MIIAWTLTGIVGLICYETKVLQELFTRPRYIEPSNRIMYIITRYPTLSWFIFQILSVPFILPDSDTTILDTSELKFVVWVAVMEELIFRGIWFKLFPRTVKYTVISAFLTGLNYYFMSGKPEAIIIFGAAGFAYGLASRIYSVAELCMYRTVFYCLLVVCF